MIERLTASNFDETIAKQTKPVIVDFYADWCTPCKMIAPVLEEIANEGKAVVFKVDIDEHTELATKYDVRSIPNLVSFKDGKMHKQSLGVQPKANILELIN